MLEAVTSTRGRAPKRRRKVAEKNTSGFTPNPNRQTVSWTEVIRPQGIKDPETPGLNRGRTIDYEPTILEPPPTRSCPVAAAKWVSALVIFDVIRSAGRGRT